MRGEGLIGSVLSHATIMSPPAITRTVLYIFPVIVNMPHNEQRIQFPETELLPPSHHNHSSYPIKLSKEQHEWRQNAFAIEF